MKRHPLIPLALFVLTSLFHGDPLSAMEESLTPLKNGRAPEDFETLWTGYDPRAEPQNAFAHVSPHSWTLDPVESPRNNPWFLCTLAARRALTFLEQQPEVDASKLGVYGHSMGGKQTVLTTAVDPRVKASAPSCGGISDRPTDNPLYAASIADGVNLKHVSCPILFLSPSNDFHGRIDDLQNAVDEIGSDDWHVTCSPHHNHQDSAEYEVATQLWFDQHLKGNFKFPTTPDSSLELKAKKGIPVFRSPRTPLCRFCPWTSITPARDGARKSRMTGETPSPASGITRKPSKKERRGLRNFRWLARIGRSGFMGISPIRWPSRSPEQAITTALTPRKSSISLHA